jgi:hypothetical protein
MNHFFRIICIFTLLLSATAHAADDQRTAVARECAFIASFGEDYAQERQNNPDKDKAFDNALAKFLTDFKITNNEQIPKVTKAYSVFIELMPGFRPHTMGLYTLAQCLAIHANKKLPLATPEGVEMVKRVLTGCDPLTDNKEQAACVLNDLAPLVEQKDVPLP